MRSIQATTFTTTKSRKEALKVAGIGSMLSVGADSKTVKGRKLGYNTAILYMLPTDKLCPSAKAAGCRNACLVSAGRGKFNSVKQARANKTELWNSDKGLFFGALMHEIERLSVKHGDTLTVRLNGTSDIAWESFPVKWKGTTYNNIFEAFPDVQFYDYTKRVSRLSAIAEVDNYHITLSYSEARSTYASRVLKAANKYNVNVAAVFKDHNIRNFKNLPVLDGDETDLRFLDENTTPHIVALKAKGEAKKDTTGFVIIAKG